MPECNCPAHEYSLNFFTFYGIITFSSGILNTVYSIVYRLFAQSDPRTGPCSVCVQTPEPELEPESDLDLESDPESESEPERVDDPSYIPKPDKKWNLRKRRRINSI